MQIKKNNCSSKYILYANNKLNDALYDENGEIIFDASDCGRIGTVFFKFLVLDKDGLSHNIIDIPLEIIE